jgi:hypothetical protein
VRAYKRITDAKLRRQILQLMKRMASEAQSGDG